MRGWLLAACLLTLGGPAIAQPSLDWSDEEMRAIGRHGPWPPPAASDRSNRISGNPAGIVLGEPITEMILLALVLITAGILTVQLGYRRDMAALLPRPARISDEGRQR